MSFDLRKLYIRVQNFPVPHKVQNNKLKASVQIVRIFKKGMLGGYN